MFSSHPQQFKVKPAKLFGRLFGFPAFTVVKHLLKMLQVGSYFVSVPFYLPKVCIQSNSIKKIRLKCYALNKKHPRSQGSCRDTYSLLDLIKTPPY